MILPSFVLPSQQGRVTKEFGTDSAVFCADPAQFDQYELPIKYHFNSRGYRDAEWPDDLASAIWCFGGSFTMGLGVPVEHTWPQLLQNSINQRTINVSMDGASYEWVTRKIQELVKEIVPNKIVIHWSHVTRRESQGPSALFLQQQATRDHQWRSFYQNRRQSDWPRDISLTEFLTFSKNIQQRFFEVHACEFLDEILKPIVDLPATDESLRRYSTEPDIPNAVHCIQQLEQLSKQLGFMLIHTFVPNSSPDFANILDAGTWSIAPQDQIDHGRDGVHYGAKTAQHLADKIIQLINSVDAKI